ncbi:hypothetical protein PYCCODRAFT_1442528 [Trametes coccinea BRFM310]|uniref:RING-type domain-containing protein n=1 Tax=Trametes coccinea (strain BRFM310) TaxID=1353009 RepID=A0A1Y2J136_TRAC3|nr:hypothetical protein PYCCODRAFT_1442528 [Trametes coccinea BRFM310]
MLRCWAIMTALVAFLQAIVASVHAYIPAQPTNQTNVAQAAGLNFSDVSSISLLWYPKGFYDETVSYQLVGAYSTGISKVRYSVPCNGSLSKGALVHFSEDKMPNGTTTTPWIALVSCDTNSTNASLEDDIFTLAQERGAVAGLLYSLHSVTCYINPEYSDPAKFNQVMDIFSTKSLTISQMIEDEFQVSEGNSSKYYWYSPTLLNDSASVIETAAQKGSLSQPGYIFATLTAWNATTNSTDSGTTTSVDGGGGGGGDENKSTNTSLAMIILYAITGCVSALFCIVIISGAIRAIRHPERYGPRSADAAAFGGAPGTFGAQSRARGLTRAILDTFPVVKFGRAADDSTEGPASATTKDIETSDVVELPYAAHHVPAPAEGLGAQDVEVELREWQIVATKLDADGKAVDADPSAAAPAAVRPRAVQEEPEDPSQRASSSSQAPRVIPRPPKLPTTEATPVTEKDVVPDAIGRETCPICIVDFEEGDDLRVLPCEGHHRFHRDCVDQWLLELSSSCPICRQDFHALQTMMAASDDGEHLEPPHMPGAARPLSTAAARFSRYLKFARRRRQRHAYGDDASSGHDDPNRPTSVAEETS